MILGSLTFQHHPTTLQIDGVRELHRRLFALLDTLEGQGERATCFNDYMAAHFCLHRLEEAGLEQGKGRGRADYQRLLRGWLFDADGREGAVLKGWVESRFGLLTRYHGAAIRSPEGPEYHRFLEARSSGLYNTNALEAQLDLVFEFCQYELGRSEAGESHLTLYRGVNHLGDYELLDGRDRRHPVLLLNNLNSFTRNRERADEFGDYILRAEVPLAKLFFYSRLLPGVMRGEEEYMVIGGVYRVTMEV